MINGTLQHRLTLQKEKKNEMKEQRRRRSFK
jgi:hypothetical protein